MDGLYLPEQLTKACGRYSRQAGKGRGTVYNQALSHQKWTKPPIFNCYGIIVS